MDFVIRFYFISDFPMNAMYLCTCVYIVSSAWVYMCMGGCVRVNVVSQVTRNKLFTLQYNRNSLYAQLSLSSLKKHLMLLITLMCV